MKKIISIMFLVIVTTLFISFITPSNTVENDTLNDDMGMERVLKDYDNFSEFLKGENGREFEGTASNPYLITSEQDMYDFANLINKGGLINISVGKHFKVDTNTKSNYILRYYMPPGCFNVENSRFGGVFDGNGANFEFHYSDKFSSDITFTSYGLFGATIDSAVIKNLSVSGEGYIQENRGAIGSIAGRNSGKIFNVYSTVKLTSSSHVSGLVGIGARTDENKIQNVYFTGELRSYNSIASGFMNQNSQLTKEPYYDNIYI